MRTARSGISPVDVTLSLHAALPIFQSKKKKKRKKEREREKKKVEIELLSLFLHWTTHMQLELAYMQQDNGRPRIS